MKLIGLLLFFTTSHLSFALFSEGPNPLRPQVQQYLCTDSLPEINNQPYTFPYQLSEPEKTVKLSSELVEISGLSTCAKKHELCAVQDEKGIIYLLDRKKGTIEDKFRFWKDGDYEGIEVIGDNAYVVKSTGTIYEVEAYRDKDRKVTKYNSFLNRDNDVEGLCYDAKNHRLLLACKGRPATGQSLNDIRYKKCVYSFDLTTKQLDSIPAYELSLEAIQDYLHTNPMLRKLDKLLTFFTAERDNLSFNPSAIAIHPETGNLYLTSSVGKVLLVLNSAGEILYIEKLDKTIHRQPEGLAFDHKGRLYISNEGKEGKARIHRFAYLRE
ncbi:MAG: SdiA-regulated domain-containing protein [Bacteroidota bacterium]